MPHLRPWREFLGLSRQQVANKLFEMSSGEDPVDQATIAKWETGRVHAEDLIRLARVYGITADRLFFSPGDKETPARLAEAHSIISTADPEAVKAWLAMGKALAPKASTE